MIEAPVSRRGPFCVLTWSWVSAVLGWPVGGQPEGHPPTGPALRADRHKTPAGSDFRLQPGQ